MLSNPAGKSVVRVGWYLLMPSMKVSGSNFGSKITVPPIYIVVISHPKPKM
jgi:hypothetical protein